MAYHNLTHAGNLTPGAEIVTLPCANLFNGKYRYTDDLLKLAIGSGDYPTHGWPAFPSPIQIEHLRQYLDSYPDQQLASYIAKGLTQGFHIGYHDSRDGLHSRGLNHPSAQANPTVVDERIQTELSTGRLLGPLSPREAALVYTSPLDLVPKTR